jgi:hypothetical protein
MEKWRQPVLSPEMTTVPTYYEDIQVVPAENVPFHTPAQVPPSGLGVAVSDGSTVHKLFQPIKIRGVEFHNRIFVRPSGSKPLSQI